MVLLLLLLLVRWLINSEDEDEAACVGCSDGFRVDCCSSWDVIVVAAAPGDPLEQGTTDTDVEAEEAS